jgi:effector-binding domain-containing protein
MIQKGAEYNFTLGLNSLKKFVESNKDVPDYNGYQIHDDIISAKSFIGINTKSTMADFDKTIGESFNEVLSSMGTNNIAPIGHPIIVWNNFKPEGISEFTCLMEINNKSENDGVNHSMHYSFPERRAVWLEYKGAYEKSSIAWETLDSYIANQDLQMSGSPYEEYVTDPSTEPDTSKWITNIYFPVKDN